LGGVVLLTQKNLKTKVLVFHEVNILIGRFFLDQKRFFYNRCFSTACLLRSFLFIREVHL